MADSRNFSDKTAAIKSETEIALISRAAEINDRAFSRLLNVVREGITEIELRDSLESFLTLEGGQGIAFDTIVAFGENGCIPHAVPSSRKLISGDLITVDWGCKYEGYCSDITRTFAFGRPSADMLAIFNAVLASNKVGIDAVKDGMSGEGVDAVCRAYLAESGYAKYFIHGTGHGVGKQIHECPRLGVGSDDVLKTGMVVTVEPGVYIEGLGGVRIEDLMVVESNGVRLLSKTPKELIIL